MRTLEGKVALVTGASKGIGAGIARELAGRGAAVAVNYFRDKVSAERVVGQIAAAGGRAIAVQADLADPASAHPLVEMAATQLGPIDILVNNAGVYEFAPLDQITPEHFYRQVNLNIPGLLMVTQAAVKRFNLRGGSIINIGASGVKKSNPQMIVYQFIKGGLNTIVGALAKQLGPRNIRVNVLSPGLVETEGSRAIGAIDSEFQRIIEADTPLGRIGQMGEITKVAAFLASSDSEWVNGQILFVDGGYAG